MKLMSCVASDDQSASVSAFLRRKQFRHKGFHHKLIRSMMGTVFVA